MQLLITFPKTKLIVVTSPTYEGVVSDIPGIVKEKQFSADDFFCKSQTTHAAHVDVQKGDVNRLPVRILERSRAGVERRDLAYVMRRRDGFFQRFQQDQGTWQRARHHARRR